MAEEAEVKEEKVAVAPVEKAPSALKVLLGEKVAMTQMFTPDGQFKAVTVVRVGPCSVLRVKTRESKDGYSAVLLGYGVREKENISKPLGGQFKSSAIMPRHLKEFRVTNTQGLKQGQLVDLDGRFTPGDYVDVRGISKGKGFAGVMKRHHFRGLPASHGASDKERSPGSLTARRSLGRVLPGQRMAGHMGNAACTVQKVEILSVDTGKHLVYLNGSVPGASGSLVSIQETIKRLKHKRPPPPKSTVKRDKMGNIITEKSAKAKKK